MMDPVERDVKIKVLEKEIELLAKLRKDLIAKIEDMQQRSDDLQIEMKNKRGQIIDLFKEGT